MKKTKRFKHYKSSPAKTAKALKTLIEFCTKNEPIDKHILAEMLGVTSDQSGNKLITANDAALTLGCSSKKLANDRVTGCTDLPHVKIGSRVYYQQSDIASFIERNVRISTSQIGGAK